MIKEISVAVRRCMAGLDALLFPADVLCMCCDRALDDDARDGVCSACCRALDLLNQRQEAMEASKAILPPEGIDGVHAAFPYEEQARRLIRLLKYRSVRAASVPLAKRMLFLPSGEEEIIVPVPTDAKRRSRRGFNQATLLAGYVGRELGMEVREALVRIDSRRPQTGLPAEKRLVNLKGCMAASRAVSGRRVLLIDDVYTTGATVCEAARALRAAGAAGVSVFTAAYAGGGMDEQEDPFQPEKARASLKKPEKTEKTGAEL